MLYKDIDSKKQEIQQLKMLLLKSKNPKQKNLIKADLTRVINGYESEKDNAYYLGFNFKESPRSILLHDIRIEHDGKVAQIDHIIIDRLGIEILESKSFTGTLTIKGDGSLNVQYGSDIETFPNPIEQNHRHAKVLADFIKANITLPSNLKLLGMPISSTVLINPKTTIADHTLPKGFERADSFTTHWDERVDKMGTLSVFKSISTMITLNKAKEIAEFLVKSHKPKVYDYSKKYPIHKQEVQKKEEAPRSVPAIEEIIKETFSIKTPMNSKEMHCSKCQSTNLEIRYGRYSYYFKCLECEGNTSIKLNCSDKQCKPKLKKKKLNFYHVCEVCHKNELFFKNPEPVMEKAVS